MANPTKEQRQQPTSPTTESRTQRAPQKREPHEIEDRPRARRDEKLVGAERLPRKGDEEDLTDA